LSDIITLRWQDWTGAGLEHVALAVGDEYITAHSVLIGETAAGFPARYSLKLRADWTVIDLQVEMMGSDKSIYLRRTQESGWLDAAGEVHPELNEATDVDLAATPFTNTLPIRRLSLAIGESAEIVVAYVSFRTSPSQRLRGDKRACPTIFTGSGL